jgi:hypothetical protein
MFPRNPSESTGSKSKNLGRLAAMRFSLSGIQAGLCWPLMARFPNRIAALTKSSDL